MARRGVLQLQKLTLNYCEHSGSSAGIRDYINKFLPDLKNNSSILVETNLRPTRHPFIFAEYKNGNSRPVDVKNKSPEDIDFFVGYLKTSAGRKTTKKLETRHITERPSIQGRWTADSHP